jgi:hypothetical protein
MAVTKNIDWSPETVGQRFITYNPGVTKQVPGKPGHVRQPRTGTVIVGKDGKHWKVVLTESQVTRSKFFEIQYFVQFDDRKCGEWVRHHIVDGMGEHKGGPTR